MLISSGPFTLKHKSQEQSQTTIKTDKSKHSGHKTTGSFLVNYAAMGDHTILLGATQDFLKQFYLSQKFYLRKLSEHSVATALANNVLPVPGGPNSNTPANTKTD